MPSPPSPTLKPFLGLPSRLILSSISIPLISLLFVGFRLLSSSRDASDSVATTKTKLLTACHAAEHTASLAASLPHFLAAGANAQLAQSITATVHGAARVFELSLTAIEKILTYIVDSYRSLFLCFMELLVRGSLAVLIEAVQLISQAVTAAGEGIRAAIQESISGVNSILSTAVSGINDVVGVFGQHINAPRIGVPNLTALENITLPHEIQDGLIQLNASLPTLAELKQKMDALIETPFERMKAEVNQTLGGWKFNETVFEAPAMENVTFCDRVDMQPLDALGEELRKVGRWGLILLAVVAIAVVLVSVGWEWWCYKREIRAVERTRSVYIAQYGGEGGEKGEVLKTENLTSLLTISRHPLISAFTLSFCTRIGIRTKRAQDRFSWFVSFLTHPASLACLFTGLLGLLSVSLQTYLIHRLTSNYASNIDTSLTHLSTSVTDLVNNHTRNASLTFAHSANTVITELESELNNHVFTWVNTTTSTMNATLNEFLDGITDALTTTFGGTPFNAPLQTFVQCIVGQKVRGVEKALTWIQDNAHVDFNLVPDDVLMLDGSRGEAALAPVRQALVGGANGGEDGEGMVGKVVAKYEKRLREERVLFAVLVGIWVAILLIGLVVVMYATLADARLEKEKLSGGNGGDRRKESFEQVEEKLQTDLRDPPNVPWIPFARFSRRTSKSKTPAQLKDLVLRPHSPAPSNQSHKTHVTKNSISYPFQVHHSISTAAASSPRARQPTPLRNMTTRNTVLSLSPAPPIASNSPNPEFGEERRSSSSWLSFLATLATSDDEASRGGKVEETAEDRFQRLFGCSPVGSPTTPRFSQHTWLLPQEQVTWRNVVKGEDKKEVKYRETLDLLPMQDWIGSKSPLPQSTGTKEVQEGEATAGNTNSGRITEIHLTRSKTSERQAGNESYAFADTPNAPKTEQAQQRVPSTQSISFYAW